MNKSKCTVCSTSLEAVSWGRCFSVSLLRETKQVFFLAVSQLVSQTFLVDVSIFFSFVTLK